MKIILYDFFQLRGKGTKPRMQTKISIQFGLGVSNVHSNKREDDDQDEPEVAGPVASMNRRQKILTP